MRNINRHAEEFKNFGKALHSKERKKWEKREEIEMKRKSKSKSKAKQDTPNTNAIYNPGKKSTARYAELIG